MGRIPRWRLGKGVYHVFNRGVNSAWILSRPGDRDFFCHLLSEQKKHFNMEIYHYAVMSSHFHLALEALDTLTLSAYVGRVSALYSRHCHKENGGGNGSVWQGRFKSIVVQKELYLNRLGRYIERNPVAAGVEGVASPADYKWSSAGAYVSDRIDSIVAVDRHPYRKNWGDSEMECRKNYLAYINNGDDDGEKAIFTSSAGAWLGDENFRQNLEIVSGRLSSRKRGRRRTQ